MSETPEPVNTTAIPDLDKLFQHGQTFIIKRSSESGLPIQFVTQNISDVLGYQKNELITSSHSYTDLVHIDDLLSVQESLFKLNSGEMTDLELDYRLKHQNGDFVWVHDICTPEMDSDGNVIAYNSCVQNITGQKNAETSLKRYLLFDPLTSLVNRKTLIGKLDDCIHEAKTKRVFGCIISINLDRFKFINSHYGYDIGDSLLQQVGRRLKKVIRSQDIVARVSADEFVCVITEINKDKNTTEKIAQKTSRQIREIISNPYNLADKTVKITASCGISLFPDTNLSADELLKFSDIALSNAKQSGQNNIQLFNSKMHEQNNLWLDLEYDLVQALNKREIKLHFQPIINSDRNIIAFESLLRWHHPEKGNIPPGEFIQLAENTGLLQRLGQYVIENACEQISIWEKDQIVCDGRIRYVSVNVSPNQFWHTDFEEHLSLNIKTKNIDPKHLLIEITENIFIADLQDAIDKLINLKKTGFKIALDDFGSGYSSLSYLMQLPIDIVKLDRAFVHNVHKDPVKSTIIKSVCEIAKKLNLKVIAEGLETVEELETLVKYNCDAYQGFYFHRPFPIEDLEKILQKKPEIGFNDINNTTEIPVAVNAIK